MLLEQMINYRDAQCCAFSWICAGSDLVEEDERSGCGLQKNFVDFTDMRRERGQRLLYLLFISNIDQNIVKNRKL